MKAKHTVHNLIILDESGSMNSIKHQIISGFNELVQTIKGVAEEYPEQEHYITFISFNTLGTSTHLDGQRVKELEEINGEKYQPRASTPLFDAMGFGINKLRAKSKGVEANTNVLVTVLTDGLENASREYNKAAIKSLVEEMEAQRWTFTYIGTDHDVERFADSLSIKNTMSFDKSFSGIQSMFRIERASRGRYSQKIRENKDTKSDYYSEE